MNTDSVSEDKKSLDDVLLAMDVVDTLRHRERLVLRELDAETREAELIARLREIYDAQGIEVPDEILREGVKALEDNRFIYTPPKNSIGVRLAKIYISRSKWLKPLSYSAAAFASLFAVYEFGIAGPQRAEEKAQQLAYEVTYPQELAALRDKAQSTGQTEAIDTLAETHYQDGLAAIDDKDKKSVETAKEDLELLISDLNATYTVRIVSRPGEWSTVNRYPENNPNHRNYYLIVEAIDPTGRALEVEVKSEEDQTTKRVTKWAVRVPKSVYDDVVEDKSEDHIVQNDEIGQKTIGYLKPTYTVEVRDGAIFEW